MVIAASPMRLQEELIQSAAATAKRFHRSTAEQVEGRAIAPDEVFNDLEKARTD